MSERLAPQFEALLPIDGGPLAFAVKPDDVAVEPDNVMAGEFFLRAVLNQ